MASQTSAKQSPCPTSPPTSGKHSLPFLTHNHAEFPQLIFFHRWRIAGPNGSEVDPTTVPDFDVSVYASTATQNSPDELPVWSAFVPLADVTMGKAGGATAASLNITEVAGNATAAVTSAVGQVASQVTGLVGSATALLGGATATA